LQSVIHNHGFSEVDGASKIKLFLKPAQIPEVILGSDSEESENDNSETVGHEDDYEQLGRDQSFL
jgi:hypothetical protein